jgi:hypothetical protein
MFLDYLTVQSKCGTCLGRVGLYKDRKLKKKKKKKEEEKKKLEIISAFVWID